MQLAARIQRPRFVAMQQIHASRCWFSASAAAEEAESKPAEKPQDAVQKRKRIKKKEQEAGGDVGNTAATVVLDFKTNIREYKFPRVPNAKAAALPTYRSLITVIRGPHIDKKSREQFDIQTRKWRVTIKTETSKLREKLDFLKNHRVLGVEISAKFHYMTRLHWPLKPTKLNDEDKWKMYRLRSQNPEVYTVTKLASEFKVEEDQVYHVLRTIEERVKHKELFSSSS